MLKKILIVAAVFGLTQPAYCQDVTLWDVNIPLAEFIGQAPTAVIVSDQVSDGCWLQSENSKTSVELLLARNGIGQIVDINEFYMYSVALTAVGFSINNGCAINVNVNLYKLDTIHRYDPSGYHLSSTFSTLSFTNNSILTGPKDNMSERIQSTFYSMTEKMLVESIKEKNKLKQKISISEATADQKAFWTSGYKN